METCSDCYWWRGNMHSLHGWCTKHNAYRAYCDEHDCFNTKLPVPYDGRRIVRYVPANIHTIKQRNKHENRSC